MKIISTNIGKPITFEWNGKKEQTGIFKYPTDNSLFLSKNDVKNDTVIDRIHHGGINKAVYLFSADYYEYWKKIYPQLAWDWGMFGENLTVAGLDEYEVRIGDIYKIGEALVQISQPREPCYKLGVRFNDQKIIKQFVEHNHPGTYAKILEEGHVKTGNEIILVQQSSNSLTVQQFYALMFSKVKDQKILQLFMDNAVVPQYKKEHLLKYIQY